MNNLKGQLQKHLSKRPVGKLKEMRITKMDDNSFHIEHHHENEYGDIGYQPKKEFMAKTTNEVAKHLREHWGGGLKDTAENQKGGGKFSGKNEVD